MLPMKLTLWLVIQSLPLVAVQSQPILSCANIPENQSFADNLAYLWDKAVLQNVDRYAFLTVSPFLIILQVLFLKFYYSNPKIFEQPGMLYCVIIVFELLFNLHYLGSAVFYSIYEGNTTIPDAFPAFCEANSIIATFFETIHFIFLLMVPLYVVYVLRQTLKSNVKIWTAVYVVIFLFASAATYLLWSQNLLGLNIFGLCGVSFIRRPDESLAVPIASIAFNSIFLLAGMFTLKYFTRHMPNTLGLRRKKLVQKQILIIYVVGYSFFWLFGSAIEMTLYYNCISGSPQDRLLPLISIYNILRLLQCFLVFFIVLRTKSARRAFKKFLRGFVSQRREVSPRKPETQYSQSGNNEILNFQEVLMDIKEERNEIDLLRISQIVTIVSGIYIAYQQYYRPTKKAAQLSGREAGERGPQSSRKIKTIHFLEKISIKLNARITKDFIVDYSLLPRLGILECTMLIHAPKVFQVLLDKDGLQNIFQSFELQRNTQKMFDLVEGQGGRSGQFFFFSFDNKYVLKTINQEEFDFIESSLVYFYDHYLDHTDSLLAKIYGLFTLHGDQIQRTYHLILMKNILGCASEQIVRTYDMKGSRDNRQVQKGHLAVNELQKVTLKDIDFMRDEGTLHISSNQRTRLQEAIAKDTIFLKNLNLIDYSLLVVRVHWPKPPPSLHFWAPNQRIASNRHQHQYYHIGIIDYLQRWDLQKRSEKWWKRIIGKKDISAQKPKKYQQRFVSFLKEITTYEEARQSVSIDSKSVRKSARSQTELASIGRKAQNTFDNVSIREQIMIE